jgi:4-hydroxy-3-methylbut-2-en-1-yl diphosphate reductase
LKSFNVPTTYRSNLITAIKNYRKQADKLKKDFTPTLLDFGPVQIYLARHFGFCYGVENAIEIAFKTVAENPNKKIYLLSEMIHNPQVNADLLAMGVTFLQDTYGKTLVDINTLTKDDIVIIPAFGTTLAMEATLKSIGIATEKYNTTCPFVEKVWNRSEQIAQKNYTIIIHGKPTHEETRATFSHAAANAPAVIVNDMADAQLLATFINGQQPAENFYTAFANKYSTGFDVTQHLQKIGVVNQTTMLATDTQAIADFLKTTITTHYGATTPQAIANHFADTRDTLCYATTDNQNAVYGLLQTPADFAIVVGGYNSSNTSHLVELCEEKLSTYYIDNANKILNEEKIEHHNFHTKQTVITPNYLPKNNPTKILITSGASCPDAVVEQVIETLLGFFTPTKLLNEFIADFTN